TKLKARRFTLNMKKSGFAFVIFLFLLASCNDGAVEVEIKIKNYGCSDNASLANKKPSFEFTLTEKKGQCDANCILYVDTVDHTHNRKQHMGSVDVYKDSFQLYVLETNTETKCHHWAEGRHKCTKSKCKVGYE
ncbi:MAG: hypothetical protein QF495_13635, partial [SAR324 cluster bacterium]|nr:hypothetical protein [SAR324 cluster bacterium]